MDAGLGRKKSGSTHACTQVLNLSFHILNNSSTSTYKQYYFWKSAVQYNNAYIMFLIEKYLNYYYTEKNFMLTGNAVRMQFCNLERFPTRFE